MEWSTEMTDLYEQMVSRMPETVRPIVGPALHDAAEKKCVERGGKSIAEVDLVVSLFQAAPPAFHPTVIKDLEDLGVSYERYMAKVSSNFKHNTNLEQLLDDLEKLAEIVGGVNFDRGATWKTLKAYEKFFIGSPLSIRATTKPLEKRDVSARYVELMEAHDPNAYITALNEGLVKEDDHPIYKMIKESIETFEVLGYGVDIDIRRGFSKIWPFVVPQSTDPIFEMHHIPQSIKNYKDYFEKHDLTLFSLFAFDFINKTTNIYFMLSDPSQNTADEAKGLVTDLGLEAASDEVMEYCSKAAHLNYSFSWDSDKLERVCFGMVCHDEKEIPYNLHPLFEKFVKETPLQSGDIRKFIYSITFTPNGQYYKIENDYTGSMADFLLLGAKAGLKSYK